MKISIIFKQKPEFVILSASEVSKNSKCAFNPLDFSPLCKRLKMTKSAVIASFDNIKVWQTIKFRLLPKFVILSASEVSKNGKFSFNLCGFFCCGLRLATRWVAFLQRLKMTKRAPKPKNKAFKNFSVPKSASNEREREREVPRPNTVPFSPC